MIEYMLHIFDVLILDAEGQLVLQQQLIGSTSGLNISALKAGVYVVKVYSDGELKSPNHVIKRDE